MAQAVDELYEALKLDNPFDPSHWLSEQIRDKASHVEVSSQHHSRSFRSICEMVKKELEDIIGVSAEDRNEGEWLERQHQAVIGNKEAVRFFTSKIKEVLRKHNITSGDFPSFYKNLAEAVFHEVWGLSILFKWETYADSEAAVIRGTELWIDVNGQFIRQSEQFESPAQVERVKRALLMRMEDAILNKQNPEVEIEREDGSRITMIQKPRGAENYVMFRRFTVQQLNLEEQARRDTIPVQDIPIYQALARTMPNTLICGRVRSAKSTFLKTMVQERDPRYVVAVMEKHHELRLSKHMPDRLIFEVQAKEGDLHKAMPRLLRMEHDYLIVGEIRSLEIEGFMEACERGERGALSTYHLTDVENIVPQLARHLLDEYPNRTPALEMERVARNLDIIIVMSADRDRIKKRVMSVSEVVWDDETRTHQTVDLIRYNRVTGKYYYSSAVSKRLLRLMAEENQGETKKLVELLRQREQESPMSDLHKDGSEELSFLHD